MKRMFLSIAIACSLMSNAAHAQFNENFDQNSTVWNMVKCDNGEFCTISGTGFRRYDFNGNLLWERYYYDLPVMTQFACRLVHTDDDGIIYFSSNSSTINPVAVKLDASGNVVWAKEYLCTPAFVYLFTNFMRVDAERMPIDEENYIFTTTGSPAATVSSPNNQPSTIEVLRIDKNGNVIWNHKYYEAPGSSYYVKDLVNTLSYAGIGKGGKPLYYLAGVRVEYPTVGSENYAMYQMMIDFDGNITAPYQRVPICTYPFGIDALYDADDKTVVTTLTMGDCGLVGAPTASQIGVIKTDEYLNINSFDYYWKPNTNENYSGRIEKTGPANTPGYVISGWCNDPQMYTMFGDYSGARNMTLLKIDKKGVPLFYKHYMVGENAGFTPEMFVNQDPLTGFDSYVMSAPTTPHSGGTSFGRLVGTDNNGDVCGVKNFDVKNATTHTNPLFKNYIYNNYTEIADITITETSTQLQMDYCHFDVPYGYRPVGNNNLNNNMGSLKVYPTLLNSGQSIVNIVTDQANTSGISISVLAIDGRVLLQQTKANIAAGEVIQTNIASLNAGNYFITIKSKDGLLNNTTKISKL